MAVNLRNNPGSRSKEDLINGFIVRTKPFRIIYEEIQKYTTTVNARNFLIIGQRGAGKTTLVYRLKYEIEDSLLGTGVLPMMFSEEQYSIYDLENFFEAIVEYLIEQNVSTQLRTILNTYPDSANPETYLSDAIYKSLKDSQKSLVLFVENIDVLFKKIGLEGQALLKRILSEGNNIHLIATSTNYCSTITDNNLPFCNFFKIIELKGLTQKESIEFLLKIGEQYGQSEKIELIIKNSPKRVESLRRLTGGIPRTMSYLFNIFLDNINGNAINDLLQIIDTLTFLYKSELDQLTPPQQKVIDIIAKNWDAISVKEITKLSRFESKQVSSILQLLDKNQIVETVSTKNKINLYRIRERFMNIWYLMRFGKRHDKENVLWLVRFYDTWCDKIELAQQINTLIEKITDGKFDHNAALFIGNTFLSCENVSGELKYNLYKTAKEQLPRELIKELKYSNSDLYGRVNKLVKAKKSEEAIRLLNDVPDKNEEYYKFAYYTYIRVKEFDMAENATKSLLELKPNDGTTLFRTGYFYDRYTDNPAKAIDFYKSALELQNYQAALMLGRLHALQGEWKLAEEFTLIAAEHNIPESYMPLASIYFNLEDFEKAEKYAEMAVDAKYYAALINLGILAERKGDLQAAESYYREALAKRVSKAHLSLGILEMAKSEPDYMVAKVYLLSAYENRVEKAGFYLGSLLIDHFDEEVESGVGYLEEAVRNNNPEAAHLLGHFYEKNDDDKSKYYFLEAFQNGRKSALLCYVHSLIENGKVDKKAQALDLMKEHLKELNEIGANAVVDYALVELWNDEVVSSLQVVKGQLIASKSIAQNGLEREIFSLLRSLTDYFLLLIAKGRLTEANELFQQTEFIDLKQMLKPIYYALMELLKEEYPKEYLKAGEELQDTIKEVLETIDSYKAKI